MRIAISVLMMSALAGCSVYGQAEAPPPVYGPTDLSPVYGQTDAPPPVPGQEQPEVLTSGPVHEAFAEPVDLQDQQGLEVQQEPPAMIEETPPAERPQGDQYVWIPGYWAWDPDHNGYVWVSACWRAAPPGTSWVPGYWARTTGGWVWVAGFWTPTTAQQIQYLPTPPVYEDVEPPGPAPSPDVIWVPPCPYWYQDHYIRRAGYWVQAQQGWVWVPSHYIWTPRGYAFVEGHWDYALDRRGVLFAPIYFAQPYFLPPAYTYTPSIVIDIGALEVSLFTSPRYCHYYFGDYYGDTYLSLGIYPWFQWEQRHTWYDPIYVYDRWRYRRTDPGWADDQRREYERRRGDRDLRPPRTYRELQNRISRAPEAQRGRTEIARPLRSVAATRSGSMTFQRINRSTQRQIGTQATNTQRFREQRNRWESTVPVPRERMAQPFTERGRPMRPPEQGRMVTPPAAERRPEAAGQRPVPVTRPETVNIPRPPVRAREPSGWTRREASPPPRPNEERQGERGGPSRERSRDRGGERNDGR
jgi:hypothetical protein